MDKQVDVHGAVPDIFSWSDLSTLIETSVTKAVTASVTQAMSKLQTEITNLSERITALDDRSSIFSSELIAKTTDNSSRIIALEGQMAQLANQCASDSILLDLKTGALTEAESAIRRLQTDNIKLLKSMNDLDQQSRSINLRITGLGVQAHSAKLEICSFIRNKLNISSIMESDISKVTTINKKNLASSTTPSSSSGYSTKPVLIVTFDKQKTRDEVLMKRRHLKGSHIGISEDLTPLNSQFIATHRKDPRIKDIWSWNGKLFMVLTKDGRKRSVNPALSLDCQLPAE
jgi:hypothetical protein